MNVYPKLNDKSFKCLCCHITTTHSWNDHVVALSSEHINYLEGSNHHEKANVIKYVRGESHINHIVLDDVYVTICDHCHKPTIWLNDNQTLKPVLPSDNQYPSASDKMPQKVKDLYNQAGSIADKSPRAANAMLRSAIEELMYIIMKTQGDLNDMIDRAYNKNIITTHIKKSLHSIRLLGNNALHPNQIRIEDDVDTNDIFNIINHIVDVTIHHQEVIENIENINIKNKKAKKNNV